MSNHQQLKTSLAVAAIEASQTVLVKSATASEDENQVINHLLSTEGMSKKASLALLLATGDAITAAN